MTIGRDGRAKGSKKVCGFLQPGIGGFWRVFGPESGPFAEPRRKAAVLTRFGSGAEQARQPLGPEPDIRKTGDPKDKPDRARTPGEVEEPPCIDQRAHGGDRDGDGDEGLRDIELVVAQVEPVVFFLQPLGLGARLLRAGLVLLDVGLVSGDLLRRCLLYTSPSPRD